MSQNRRKRSRNRNRATTGDVRTQTPQKPPQQKRNEPKIDPVEFWGDPAALPEPIRTIDEAPDPKAVVRSLGRGAAWARDGVRPNTGSRWSTSGRRCLPVPWPLPEDSSVSPTRSDQRSVVQGVLRSSPLADCPVG